MGPSVDPDIQYVRGVAGINKHMIDLIGIAWFVTKLPSPLMDVFMGETGAANDKISTSCEVYESTSVVCGFAVLAMTSDRALVYLLPADLSFKIFQDVFRVMFGA